MENEERENQKDEKHNFFLIGIFNRRGGKMKKNI